MRVAFSQLRSHVFPAAAAATAATALHQGSKSCRLEYEGSGRLEELPSKYVPQRFVPAVPYPGWDHNWDYLKLSAKDIARELRHKWPITDYAAAIRQLFAEHYHFSESSKYKTPEDVERLISKRADDLPELYREAFMTYAWGGAPTRFIILVRHGQYEEQRDLVRRQRSEVGLQQFDLDDRLQRDSYLEVDAKRVLTSLGRRQAQLTGDRLAQLLKPALTTPGREADVRIHVSTATRAKETAEVIASRLPAHVRRMPPDPNLSEGNPIMDMPGCNAADPAAIHVEGARIEAAFRSLFYRGVPRKRGGAAADEGAAATLQQDKFRCEYDIVVCHCNVIRYFFLRGLQLPPEAWLRFGGFNGSITILRIRPVTGRVGVMCFGDFGHMSLEETTFGMSQGLET
mmetsp:Transcript_80367/g.222301  ORF Transcript_80367/g.222301 Transcript_80367/m.222301 type:complete len:400 (+) Transcript_80367:95-1294(+)